MSQHNDGAWILPDCYQFIINRFLSERVDEPLNLFLRRTYAEVLGKLCWYSKCDRALHLLANTMYDGVGRVSALEIEHLFISASSPYLKAALEFRYDTQQPRPMPPAVDDYVPIRESEQFVAAGLHKHLYDPLVVCATYYPTVTDASVWNPLICRCEQARANAGASLAHSQMLGQATSVIVIPFSVVTNRLPAGHLGTAVLWRSEKTDDDTTHRVELLRQVSRLLSSSIDRFLKLHYEVTDVTYLPSYRRLPKTRFFGFSR